MPTTANSITYYVAADGTLRDGPQGSIPQQPRINYGTEYAVTLSFPPSTIAEGDQLQVALNRTRTFFSSASATGDAPVAAVAKHDVTAEEAAAQEVAIVLSTNTRAMIDQVNGIDHPVRGFFGVHVLRGQSFVTLAVADALMMSLESGPDAISPSLPVVDYPTREEAEQIRQDTIAAQEKAEQAQAKAEEAQGKAETAEDNAQIWAEGTDQQVEELGGEHSAKEYDRLAGVSATNAENAKTAAQTAQGKAEDAQDAAETAQANAGKIAEGSDADVAPLGLEHSAKGWAQEAAAALANKRDILQTLVTSSSTALVAEAGKSYNWTVAAASTIALATADKVAGKETRIDIYIDLQDGGSVSGDGVAVSDAVLQSGWYKLIWDGTNATLYSTKAGGAASIITIPSSATSYSLQDNKHYQQVPSAVPTYTLPVATMDGLVHEITVLVDFMHVTSCSFVDASGVPVTLQSAISPSIGEAYIFRCYWYGKWRVVPLKIRNAATASSSDGVVEVSDAVAGDALALKMVAPRSVVVNQLVQNGDFSDGTTGWRGNRISLAVQNAVMTCTLNNTSAATVSVACDFNGQKNHTYLTRHGWKTPFDGMARYIMYNRASAIYTESAKSVSANIEKYINNKVTLENDVTSITLYPMYQGSESYAQGDSFQFLGMQIVDLTQYFNGNQTLIDSITSWDDLVAYDPRFASYVEHNTGTVEGVQPSVYVGSPNLFNIANLEGATNISISGTTITLNATNIVSGKTLKQLVPSAKVGDRLYLSLGGTISPYYQYIWLNNGYTGSGKWLNNAYHTIADNNELNGIVKFYAGQAGETITNMMISLAPLTSYEPYHDGGTAQAPAPLFAVGNAADEFEAVAGVTTRKMGSVDLGTLYWSYNDTRRRFQSMSTYSSASTNTSICSMYLSDGTFLDETDMIFRISEGHIQIRNIAYSDPTVFKTAMSGVLLYYRLAEPTTSTSTPTQIALQAGSNVAMQTDGGRTLAELAMTYENLPSSN